MHPRKDACRKDECSQKDMDIDQSFIHWNLQDPQSISNDVYTQKWINHGQNFLKERLNLKLNNGKAKNIILFIGDGMGITTTSSSRQYLSGEETHLSFEKFPYYGLTRTYCVNRQVPDSACTATAFLG
jgi:alkaline phosphatase